MDAADEPTVASQPVPQTRKEPRPNRDPQRPLPRPPPAAAVGMASVEVSLKGKSYSLQLCLTTCTVADLFRRVQIATSYVPPPERALSLDVDGGTWQMGQGVNSDTTLYTAGFHSPRLSIRVREKRKWFTVGAYVWFVGSITADRPATVVAVGHGSPRYTIKLHHQTRPSTTEQSYLRHPVRASATIRVRVLPRDAYTVCVSLDETTSDEFIELLNTALHGTLCVGHPGVQNYLCQGKFHHYGEPGGSLFLTELGLHHNGEVDVTLAPFVPPAFPSRLATMPPPSEVLPTHSADRPVTEVGDGPNLGAGDGNGTMLPDVEAEIPPDPVPTEVSPVMLRHQYNKVNWTVDADQLSKYFQDTVSGPYQQMYPGQDNLADYNTVQVPRNKSWIAFFYHLPEFTAEGTTVADRRIVLYNSFCRFLAWTSPTVSPPPLGDKTLGMLFSNILLLQHHYVDAATPSERFRSSQQCDRWLTQVKYRSDLKPKFQQLKKDPMNDRRLEQWFGALILLFSRPPPPEALPAPGHGLLYQALVYSAPPWTTASRPPAITEPAAEATDREITVVAAPPTSAPGAGSPAACLVPEQGQADHVCHVHYHDR